MLKHPDLTLRRCKQFFEFELSNAYRQGAAPLKIEFCESACATENEAKKAVWQEVEPGFEYGPAYRTVWFRVSGRIPKEFEGREVGLKAEVGAERTLWRDNSPFHGLDEFHDLCPLFEAAPSGKVTFYIQAYTRNPQHRVHRRELPREALVEKVEGAWLVATDPELKKLMFDFGFALDLVEGLQEGDPTAANLLQALNEVCNRYRAGDPASVTRCRKLLKDATSSSVSGLKHAVTPVGHAHLDTAWLWPIEITRKKMAHTTSNQLALMERYPEYVFVHSQASQYEWLEQEYPALLAKVKAAVQKGQWEPVGSMWVEADCNLSGGEALVRQFLYGRKYFRDKLGVETEDMWLPDVFGYSAALPQILAKFGIKYFLTQKISWNQTNKFPHNTFWWQGIDGTRVWSHFPPADTYVASCRPSEILRSVLKNKDAARGDQSLYVYGHGDGGGGPTEQHLEYLRRARNAPGMPEIAGSKRAVDFFREAYDRSRDLQTWVGELYLEYHRGTYTSQAANKRDNRYCEFLLRDAEALACFRDDFPKSYPAAQLEALWKLVLLNQFHDILPGSSVHEVYEDSAIDYAKVKAEAGAIVEESLKRIASKMATEGMENPVALFQNATLPLWTTLPLAEGQAPASWNGRDEILPVQTIECFGERKAVFPTPQAALGSVAVGDLTAESAPARYRLKAAARKLENHEFSVKFDSNGHITSVQSLEDGSEFIAPGKAANVFQLFEDKPLFWSAWDIDPFALETVQDLMRVERFEVVERGPVRAAVEIERRFGSSRITQRISMGPYPGIWFETEVDWREEDKMLKVAFPVNVNAARATHEIQFGNVERPTHINTTWDQAKFEVCAHKWVDLSEGDQGIALINDSKYGHDIRGNVMRLTLLRAPKAPDPECDMGVHRFTYGLLPHYGPYHYAGVVQVAYALNAPTRHAKLQPNGGAIGCLPPLVSCEDRNLVVETVKKAEKGSAIIVRLYECHNARGKAELSCARMPRTAQLCDLEENPIEDLDINEGLVMFDYKPFEIITIRLEV